MVKSVILTFYIFLLANLNYLNSLNTNKNHLSIFA